MNKNDNIKIMAFYLPQFHAIPENDAWWGKGFTDWTNVKKGKSFIKGQEQPRVPLNNNYYDLSQVETIRWQAGLVNQYGLYGLCFYHYWFNGKLLLEKPAELLLENKDINLRFCFSWANEPWARTWTGNNKQVLMAQAYGTEKEWEEHFNYLLPFFKDERYIKENGCPVFIVYKTLSIPNCKQMMDYWNELAQKAGFKCIHFVETIRGKECDDRNLPIKARVEFEPTRSNYLLNPILFNYNRIRRRVITLHNKIFKTTLLADKPHSFNTIAKRSIKNLSPEGTYGGAFVGWDNAARRGAACTLIFPPKREEFKEYLKKKIEITKNIYNTSYLFINAWNEWAEGTYLEPDEIHKYEYLEVIKEILNE